MSEVTNLSPTSTCGNPNLENVTNLHEMKRMSLFQESIFFSKSKTKWKNKLSSNYLKKQQISDNAEKNALVSSEIVKSNKYGEVKLRMKKAVREKYFNLQSKT